MRYPEYRKTIPLMLAFVGVLVVLKDLAIAAGLIPDVRYSLAIFCLSAVVSYGFHEAVRRGLFPWFSKHDQS